MGHELDFGMLGPLVVRRAGVVLDPGRRKQRQLLIRLLLADGRAVAGETLCEELWPPRQGGNPGGATASLYAHVSKIRAVLEPRYRQRDFEILVTEPTGYALRVPPGSRDTVRFERAVAEAHRLLGQGPAEGALREAERALGMWRGAALADAADQLFAADEAARLDELRQTAREIRTTALLLDGRVPEAVAAAQELTVLHPLRESGWALLLRALYLAGRHPEALQRYTELRRHLADQLGLGPGPELRALHDGILRHELPPLITADGVKGAGPAPAPGPGGGSSGGNGGETSGGGGGNSRGTNGGSGGEYAGGTGDGTGTGDVGGLDAPGAPAEEERATPVTAADAGGAAGVPGASADPADGGVPGEPPVLARPAQLPNDLGVFAGRTTEGAWLSALSDESEPGPVPAAGSVVVIGGAPGIGKTTFAVHHAHRIAPAFPDGQLFVDLCGFHPHAPAVAPGDALYGFLTALGVPAPGIPEDTADRTALLRSLLAGRRVLVVLDNARDEEQVRPLLPAGDGCLTLVTSRNQLTGLIATDGARPLPLPLPSHPEAHETLARRLGEERLAAEPAAAADIIQLCGRLPLALAVVAARTELEPAFPLHTVADELRQSHGSLDAFTGFDTTTDVRAVFSWSYGALDEPAARLFRLLALHPGPEITAPAAAGLAGLPLPETRRLLGVLTRACLVGQPLPGRFTLHDLLRGYATELTHAHDGADERRRATLRVLDHYMFTAHAAGRLFEHETVSELDIGSPYPGVVPEDLAGVEQAGRWFTAERRVLNGLLRTAVHQGSDRHISGLAWLLTGFADRQEFWPEAIAALTPALEAARRRGDRREEGRCLRFLGHFHGRLERFEQSLEDLELSAQIFADLGARAEQARVLHDVAFTRYEAGDIREALAPAERALVMAREAGDDRCTGQCLNGLAWLHCCLKQPGPAVAYGEEAVAVFERLELPLWVGISLDSLGCALHLLGRYEEAVRTYRRALGIFEKLGNHRDFTGSLMRLGDTRLAMGDREAAGADWVRALGIAESHALPTSAREVRERLTALDS
ncbi:BTAD domain-containing putative transcriptional regulator [Streptomyces sp. NPDC086080]|uniref:AfsR/SARP family transcriptional regulator n=1 Tax=Streptomyces sp. NPDC086080 TaxID=3365748 RepID=UPI0037D2C6E8